MLQFQKANSVLMSKSELLNHRKKMKTVMRIKIGHLLPPPFQTRNSLRVCGINFSKPHR